MFEKTEHRAEVSVTSLSAGSTNPSHSLYEYQHFKSEAFSIAGEKPQLKQKQTQHPKNNLRAQPLSQAESKNKNIFLTCFIHYLNLLNPCFKKTELL